MQNFSFSSDEVSTFAKSFLRSRLASIDSFLARRSEFVDIGKCAIATLLCAKENQDNFYATGIDDDWYFSLWNALVDNVHGADALGGNKVRIITFNYDRSLESYLYSAIKHTFAFADSAALSALNQVPILHVYGSLGKFGLVQNNETRPYSVNVDPSSLKVAAGSIKIIPEARNYGESSQQMIEWFRWASQICFLGFGFDELNVQRLGFQQVAASWQPAGAKLPPDVFASTFKMTEAEIERKRALLGIGFANKWHPFNGKSLTTLRQFGLV